jgi:hypothetical protein
MQPIHQIPAIRDQQFQVRSSIADPAETKYSRLTTEEARWFAAVRPEATAFIRQQDEKNITWDDAAEIYSAQIQILTRRGFQSLYSRKTRDAMSQGFVLSDKGKLAILKNRLKKRVKDHFRRRDTIRAGYVPPACECGKKGCKCESKEPGYSRIVEISDYRWNQILDPRSELEAERNAARDRLDELSAKVREKLSPQAQAILDAAIRSPKGLFNRTSLYEAMTEQEREKFLPDDAAPVSDRKERIKKAIAARTAEVRRTIRRIIASGPGEDEGCAA